MLEIEIKVKVDNIDEIRTNIKTIGGHHSETVTEEDIYYNAPHRDFGITDEALRVRSAGGKITLTYKGPKNTLMGSKIREEHNVHLEDAKTFDTIITSLGFKQVAQVTKLREYYTFEDFSIAVDNVEKLGQFVEIELVTENNAKQAAIRVDNLAKKIGVVGERISISYLELLLSKQ
ncbi:MAG: class IV adenylate cyclase [Methanomicrobiales archaeon]|nr:class IV adenylate cyclase [Methanomicrobiales archaeon]